MGFSPLPGMALDRATMPQDRQLHGRMTSTLSKGWIAPYGPPDASSLLRENEGFCTV